MKGANVGWFVIDCIFPLPRPHSRAEILKEKEKREHKRTDYEARIKELPENDLSEYVGECARSLAREEERCRGVEARLTTIMGLCSIAGTIVFSSIFGQTTRTLQVQRNWLRWVLGLGGLYLAVELCAAILAAVRGLSRRAYSSSDVLPIPACEAKVVYLRRRICEYSEVLLDHQSQNDGKVTQMAVAHRALRNFLWVLLLLAGIGAWGAVSG
ncbi:MAG: hypothetical protein ABSH28_01860 [Acidobacteriota bacterium]